MLVALPFSSLVDPRSSGPLTNENVRRLLLPYRLMPLNEPNRHLLKLYLERETDLELTVTGTGNHLHVAHANTDWQEQFAEIMSIMRRHYRRFEQMDDARVAQLYADAATGKRDTTIYGWHIIPQNLPLILERLRSLFSGFDSMLDVHAR